MVTSTADQNSLYKKKLTYIYRAVDRRCINIGELGIRFLICDKIGQGGISNVYKAYLMSKFDCRIAKRIQ